MLDVRRLRVLREVALRGSFSAAADALHFTQSAVSQQIAALEREAGTQLVERSARGVRLTEGGHALVRHTEVILARLADAEAELEAIAGLRGGRLRLGSFNSAGATIAPRAFAAFRERHPGIDLSLVPMERPEGIEALRCGEVDIALLIERPWDPAPEDGIDRVLVYDDPMYICMPVDHPLAGRSRLRMEELAGDRWIYGVEDSTCPDNAIFLRACQDAGFEPAVSFNTDDYLANQGFVAAGMGICFIPDLALVSVRDDVVIRAVQRPFSRLITAGTLAGGYRSPAVTAMLDVLVDVGRGFAGDRRELALAS
jgi:DNA-binding transcriptional LysR family regulator